MGLSAKVLLDEAVDFLGDEKPLHAIQILRRIILNHPAYSDAYLKLAEIYIRMHNYEAAERLLADGLVEAPEDNKLIYALGSLYFNLGDSDRALPLLKTLESWRNPGVHLALATIFLEKGEFAEATFEAKRVLHGDAKYPDANGVLGSIYLRQKNFPAAIKYLRREIALNDSSAEYRFDLATAYYMLGDLRAALEEFTLLIDTDPDFFPGWLMCGKILLELGKPGESEFYLQRALNLNPKSVEALHTLADLYDTIGEVAKARELFDGLADTNTLIEDGSETLERISQMNRKRRRRR